MASIITTNSRSIWNFLKSQGLSEYGVAGLMGNLYAESGLSPINLENTANAKLKITDEEYTAEVDNGSYLNFVYDSYGYGLAQWTWHTRKKSLYDFTKSLKVSVGDLNGQLKYLMYELKGSYANLFNTLKTTTSIKEASDAVLVGFERPADMSNRVKNLRAQYGQQFYDYFCTKKQITVNTPKYIEYTIVAGDTLWAISNRFSVSISDIVKNNQEVVPTKETTIYPGQVLHIPVSSSYTDKSNSDNKTIEETKNNNNETAKIEKEINDKVSNIIKDTNNNSDTSSSNDSSINKNNTKNNRVVHRHVNRKSILDLFADKFKFFNR